MKESHHYYHQFTVWLHHHPQWGIVIAFLVAFAESIPVVGTIVPGTITMTAIGILAGSQVLSWKLALLSVTAGAIVGDSIGFFCGYYYRNKISLAWPFKNYLPWLERGKLFINKHGGKSIFIGRFLGLTRAFVPTVAGMLQMRVIKFYMVDIISAILWPIVYMFPGFLLGAASSALPPALERQLLFIVMLILAIIWLISWLIRFFHRYFSWRLHRFVSRHWRRIYKYEKHTVLHKLLYSPEAPHKSYQLLLACLFIISAILFLALFISIALHNPLLLHFNHIVYQLFLSLHQPLLTKIALFISTLGQASIILPTACAVLVYLICKQRWYTAGHWLALILLTAGSVFILKHIVHSPRPTALVNGPNNGSFPSGHVSLSLALYGFITYLISIHRPNWQKSLIRCVIIILLLVSLSRLYLCVHWLSDILAATLLSISLLIATILSHRRQTRSGFQLLPLLIVWLGTWSMGSAYYWHKHHANIFTNYQLSWQQYHVEQQQWWQQQGQHIPLVYRNRIGHPTQLLNVQWAGNLDEIKTTLLQHHWQLLPTAYFFTQYKQKIDKKSYLKMIAVRRIQGALPTIIAINDDQSKDPLTLYLWPSHITLTPGRQPLWIGSVYKRSQYVHHFWHHRHQSNEQLNILAAVAKQQYQIVEINRQRLPALLSRHHPSEDYKIIMIQTNKPEVK